MTRHASTALRSIKTLTLLATMCAVQAAYGASYTATSSTSLKSLLAGSLNPGDTITLAANTTFTGPFVVSSKNGSAGNPITITGPSTAIVKAPGGYGVQVKNSKFIKLTGFTVQEAKKGIMVDASSNVFIYNVTVKFTLQEAVHVRMLSKHVAVKDSRVSYTGYTSASTSARAGSSDLAYAEALYVGLDVGKWTDSAYLPTYAAGTPDYTEYTCLSGNTLGPYIGADAIDVKEGARYGRILNNTIDMTGLMGQNSADNAIDIKGNDWALSANTITNPSNNTFLLDGIQIRKVSNNFSASGYRNKLYANTVNLGASNANARAAIYLGKDSGGTGTAADKTLICNSGVGTNSVANGDTLIKAENSSTSLYTTQSCTATTYAKTSCADPTAAGYAW